MALLRVDAFSKSLMRTVTMTVILPVDKTGNNGSDISERKPLKTLYLLHGVLGSDMDWVTGTRIQAWAQDHNLAVVMPSGENRFYVDDSYGIVKYGTFIGQELVELTRKMFPLSNKREDTFIGGLSMGGYGAIVNGLKYSDTFGAVIGLSSGFILEQILGSKPNQEDVIHTREFYESVFGDLSKLKGSDRDYKALVQKLLDEKKDIPNLYLACGKEDFLRDKNVDFSQFLKEHHVEHVYEEWTGGHDWIFWDQAIEKVIKWLPLGEEVKGISSGNVQKAKNF